MLKVAKMIVSGEWRGLVFGFGESGEQIPVQWDYSDGEFSDLEDDDDDYFIPGYRNRVSHKSRRRASDSYNTEVD